MMRSPRGVPLQSADYLARQGSFVRVVDVRTPEELTGPLGHIPGSDWIPTEHAASLLTRVGPDDPIVLVSRGGERAASIAFELERSGLRFVAALMGGIVSWRDIGYVTTRDAAILGRANALRPHRPLASAEAGAPLTVEALERHVGDPLSVRWMKVASLLTNGRLSCVDGRDHSSVIGTPGGDAGELLLALCALEHVSGETLDASEVRGLLQRRLDVFGRFYMHSDIKSMNALIASLRTDRRLDRAIAGLSETMQWRRFFASPPAEVEEVLLEHVARPELVGCGHLKMSMTRASDYECRPELVVDLLRAFHLERWHGAPETELAVLPGGHAEGAVVVVRTEQAITPFARMPLIAPSADGTQMFVNHPQVASFLREQIAQFLIEEIRCSDTTAEALRAEIERLAENATRHTLSALAKGLPIFEMTFLREGGVSIREAGVV